MTAACNVIYPKPDYLDDVYLQTKQRRVEFGKNPLADL